MAVESTGITDPLFLRRQLATQKKRNAKNQQILTSLRKAASSNGVQLPKRITAPKEAGDTESLANSRRALKQMVNNYINTKA